MDDDHACPPSRRARCGSRRGRLPSDEDVRAIVEAGYERFRHVDEGKVADYIPALAEASPDAFGVCVVGVRGRVFAIGDAEQEFTIQSISKLFVFALVCDTLGPDEARQQARGQQHRAAVRLGDGRRAQRGPHHEPDGQRGRARHHQPGAG